MSIRHENVPANRPADDFHRAVADDLNRHWHDHPDPMDALLRLVREAGKWVLIILAAISIVLLLGIAFLHGLTRADAMPAACDGISRTACNALRSEGGAA